MKVTNEYHRAYRKEKNRRQIKKEFGIEEAKKYLEMCEETGKTLAVRQFVNNRPVLKLV